MSGSTYSLGLLNVAFTFAGNVTTCSNSLSAILQVHYKELASYHSLVGRSPTSCLAFSIKLLAASMISAGTTVLTFTNDDVNTAGGMAVVSPYP